MASKNPKPIHHHMLRCRRVEDEALRKAGVPRRDFSDLTSNTVWHNEEYPTGPCSSAINTLRELYGEEE